MPIETLGRWSLGPGSIRELRRRMRAATLTIAHGSRTLPACAVASSSCAVVRIPEHRRRFLLVRIGPQAGERSTLALRRAVAVVALWPMARDMLMKIHGVPAERLYVIPNGVPAARFPAIDAVTRARSRGILGLENGAPVLLFLGALSNEKDPARAIRAAAAIRDACLLVAGDGPERSDPPVAGFGMRSRARAVPRRSRPSGDSSLRQPICSSCRVAPKGCLLRSSKPE